MTIEIVLLSHIFDSSSGWKSVNGFLGGGGVRVMPHVYITLLLCGEVVQLRSHSINHLIVAVSTDC